METVCKRWLHSEVSFQWCHHVSRLKQFKFKENVPITDENYENESKL